MSDLIRREDAMEVLHRIFDVRSLDSDRWLIQDIRSKIADIPSADRPQGEWEDYDRYMKCCSKCGWIQDILHFGSNFCPNCGAKMKGADDE